jgi:hypothetical protein
VYFGALLHLSWQKSGVSVQESAGGCHCHYIEALGFDSPPAPLFSNLHIQSHKDLQFEERGEDFHFEFIVGFGRRIYIRLAPSSAALKWSVFSSQFSVVFIKDLIVNFNNRCFEALASESKQ